MNRIVCARCGRVAGRDVPLEAINVEAALHHHAGQYECINRNECGRIQRHQMRKRCASGRRHRRR